MRFESTAQPPTAPLITRLRTDLKTAMRAKDTPRLNAIRAILADITDASKTKSPVTTDIQILSLCRKRAAAGRAAGEQFETEGRLDLKEKELGQVGVLEEYAGSVETVSEEEVVKKVGEALKELGISGKQAKGQLMKKLLGPGGIFEGMPVEKQVVVRAVDSAIGSS